MGKALTVIALALGAATAANFMYLVLSSASRDYRVTVDFNQAGEGAIEALLSIGVLILIMGALLVEATS